MLTLKAEYGSVEYSLYWSMSLDIEKRELLVTREDGAVTKTMVLDPKQVQAYVTDMERFKLFELPFTDYTVDHSDDLYHMGVSVRARLASRLFDHQCPTGVMVMVPSRRPTREQQVAFVTFVHSVTRRTMELSGVSPPPHILTKWKARLEMRNME